MRKYILVLIVLVLCFNGLDNLRELTDLAIVKAIGIDYSDDGRYKISVIVIDTSEKENTEKGIIYESEGESVQDAIRHIVDTASKKLYIAHMETLILSEKVAREKLMDTLDFFMRDNEGSNNFYLFIANGNSSKEIIETINSEEISMKQLLLSSAKYRGNSNAKTVNEIIKDILRPGKDIIVNSCKSENEKIVISDMAFFDEWTMLDFLGDDDSIMCNILCNNLENTIINVGDGDDKFVSEIISSNNKMELDKEANLVKINVNIEANISETGKNIKISTSQDAENAEKLLQEKISNSLKSVLDKLINEYNSDIVGIGNLLYRKKSKMFDNPEYLKNTNIALDVKVQLLNQGGVVKRW